MGWIYHSSVNSQGEQQILYKIGYQGKSLIIPTGVHGKPKYKLPNKAKLANIEAIVLAAIKDAKDKVPPLVPSALKKIIQFQIEGKQIENGEVRLKVKEAWIERIEFFGRAKKFDSKRHNQDSMRVVMSILSNYYIDEITPKLIERLRDELLIDRSPASVAGYLRDLRALIISVVGRVKSPFQGVIFPRTPKKKNIALTWEEFQLFKVAPLRTKNQELVRDMFIFRYYCLGMRIKDQLLLKRSQIVDGRISYTTHKTQKHFDFQLPKECLEIIKKYPGGKYVFPIMRDLSGEALNQYIKDVISGMNKTLDRIAKQVGIEKSLSTHSARHTFAYINQDKGAHFIQRAFDHESITTTEGYIESLSNQDGIISQVKK